MTNFAELTKGLQVIQTSSNNGTRNKYNFSNIFDFFSDEKNKNNPLAQTLGNNFFDSINNELKGFSKSDFLALKANKPIRNKLQKRFVKFSSDYAKQESKEVKLQILQNVKIALQIFTFTIPVQISGSLLKDLQSSKNTK